MAGSISISENIHIRVLNGQEARKYFEDIARMRITLFREYPYLYEGCLSYEKEYLETYFQSVHAVILLVFDNDQIVGFSNSIPLAQESEEMRAPFIQKGLDVDNYLYIGEVMLNPEYRGKGILRKFLEFHENKARNEGYAYTIFMTVERPDDHPFKPNNYQSLDKIWGHFAYEQIPDVKIHFTWKQVDNQQETANTLIIWGKKV